MHQLQISIVYNYPALVTEKQIYTSKVINTDDFPTIQSNAWGCYLVIRWFGLWSNVTTDKQINRDSCTILCKSYCQKFWGKIIGHIGHYSFGEEHVDLCVSTSLFFQCDVSVQKIVPLSSNFTFASTYAVKAKYDWFCTMIIL